MNDLLQDRIPELLRSNESFVLATVVRRQAPSSGKPGDRAVIRSNGELIGWIGGGCVRGIVIREALKAITDGKCSLIRIGKQFTGTSGHAQEDVREFHMTCQSEGMVELFIEPVLPKPHLVVIGQTAIARSLVRIAKASGYRVTGVAAGADLKTFDKPDELITRFDLSQVQTTDQTAIVVATQGDQDEKALAEALRKKCHYRGFIASRKKMLSVQEYLFAEGFTKAHVSTITCPAGIDVQAKLPDDVALSILAELVQCRNNPLPAWVHAPEAEVTVQEANGRYYVNPVCGVPVDIHNPRHVIEHKGEKVYFCCDGCTEKFQTDPDKFIQARASGLAPEGM